MLERDATLVMTSHTIPVAPILTSSVCIPVLSSFLISEESLTLFCNCSERKIGEKSILASRTTVEECAISQTNRYPGIRYVELLNAQWIDKMMQSDALEKTLLTIDLFFTA